MDTYDKGLAFVLDDVTAVLCTNEELINAGKVLVIQALVKEGLTVDKSTNFHVEVKCGGLEIRAWR